MQGSNSCLDIVRETHSPFIPNGLLSIKGETGAGCGDRASVSMILVPCFLIVEMMNLISAKTFRTLQGAEVSRDFHAQLHHAQVPFGLIVGEGNCEVRKEPQDVITVVVQADQKSIK